MQIYSYLQLEFVDDVIVVVVVVVEMLSMVPIAEVEVGVAIVGHLTIGMLFVVSAEVVVMVVVRLDCCRLGTDFGYIDGHRLEGVALVVGYNFGY